MIDTHLDNGFSKDLLSQRMTVDGFEGSWYEELNDPAALLPSWGNDRLFWLTPESFRAMLSDAAYGSCDWKLSQLCFWTHGSISPYPADRGHRVLWDSPISVRRAVAIRAGGPLCSTVSRWVDLLDRGWPASGSGITWLRHVSAVK